MKATVLDPASWPSVENRLLNTGPVGRNRQVSHAGAVIRSVVWRCFRALAMRAWACHYRTRCTSGDARGIDHPLGCPGERRPITGATAGCSDRSADTRCCRPHMIGTIPAPTPHIAALDCCCAQPPRSAAALRSAAFVTALVMLGVALHRGWIVTQLWLLAFRCSHWCC